MTKLQELDLEIEYDSEEDDVVNSFFVPVLSAGTSYKRLAGYFSSQALAIVGRGIKELLKNGGTMQLVCGHQFTQKDKEALESGSEAKDLSTDFINKLDELSDDDFRKQHVQIMGLMIANKKLEIKIADVPAGSGIFHQKIGIISDGSDTISFVGSINETANALLENTENFDVHKSWTQGGTDAERVRRHEGRFDKYWADEGTSTKVYSLPEAIKKKLLQIAKDVEIKYQARQPTPRNDLWEHQEEAITAWKPCATT